MLVEHRFSFLTIKHTIAIIVSKLGLVKKIFKAGLNEGEFACALEISLTHLQISLIHLKISLIQLEISSNTIRLVVIPIEDIFK